MRTQVLPQGLVRGLASKAIVIEDGDVGDAAALPDDGQQQGNGEGEEGGGTNMIKLQVAQGEEMTLVQRMMSSAMFWKATSSVNPGGGKRRLKRSYGTIAYLLSPFLLWGVMIIIINIVGHQQIHKIDGPIATFNMVNFVNIRIHRVFFYIQVIEDWYHAGLQDCHALQA
jgi:hypothetical protein